MRQYQGIILVLAFFACFVLIESALIGPMTAHGESKGKKGRSPKRGSTPSWGRNPFLLPPGVRLKSKSDSAVVTEKAVSSSNKKANTPGNPNADLEVRAIFISEHIRLASIDSHLVTVGDVINDEEILEIKNDRVILGKGDKKRAIFLYQSPIQVIVEKRQ